MKKLNLSKKIVILWGACLMCLPVFTAEGDTSNAPFPGKKVNHKGFKQYEFKLKDFDCKIAVPKKAADGKPWVWRARFWGHKRQVDLALLSKGFHVVYADAGGLFGAPKAVERWDEFYKYLTEKHGFAKKAVLEAMSRGGLIAFNWAAKNPDKVYCIYADAPVCDIKSWPGCKGKSKNFKKRVWQQCLKAYGLTEEEALAYKKNPIDNLEPLAKANIPLLHIVGDADEVVPVAENTALIEKLYKELGGSIQVIHKKDVGHTHGLEDPKPIIDFILKNSQQKNLPAQK